MARIHLKKIFSGSAFDCMLELLPAREWYNEPTLFSPGTTSAHAPFAANQTEYLGC